MDHELNHPFARRADNVIGTLVNSPRLHDRQSRVAGIRREIDAGTYESESKLDGAIEKLIATDMDHREATAYAAPSQLERVPTIANEFEADAQRRIGAASVNLDGAGNDGVVVAGVVAFVFFIAAATAFAMGW